MTLRDKTAIVGVGATPYFRRGGSVPMTETRMACAAILAALDDAGLEVNDLDGFALYAATSDPAYLAAALGLPEVRFAATLTSGGGGSAGALGLAAAAIVSGQSEVCVTVMALQQANRRLGGTATAAPAASEGGSSPYGSGAVSPQAAFRAVSGLMAPGHNYAMLVQRHMHLYGTRREAFAEIATTQRRNAMTNPRAMKREPLSVEDYFAGRMISDPFCIYDYTQETDGAVAVVMTSVERARDLRQPPVVVMGAVNGGAGRWGPAAHSYFKAPDEYFGSSGHRTVARRVYEMAGVGPSDVDVALIYDHFGPYVALHLEDFGFCPIGEGGPFVESGAMRMDGAIPVNPHGGHLSEAYVIGMTHVREAVEQLRGVAANLVAGAEIALVTGGTASLPLSAALLRKL